MSVEEIDSTEEFQEKVLGAKTPVLVDYSATWCGPCKRIFPTIVKLAGEFTSVSFYKVDVDELDDVAKEQKIKAMPTFVLYQDGVEVQRIIGADSSGVRGALEGLANPKEVNMEEVLSSDPLGTGQN
jgi:thioredoxin 1